jgi:hypothetical protein
MEALLLGENYLVFAFVVAIGLTEAFVAGFASFF